MTKELDYIYILKALQEIPFGVGKKLLCEFLQGKSTHASIKRNNLHLAASFGSLAYDEQELDEIIQRLILHKFVELTSIQSNAFWKVMQLTHKGKKEIINPTFSKKKLECTFSERETIITEQDKKVFSALEPFLGQFTEPQSKAVISQNKHILCIAGAGSGKTSVLTKRIDFLTKFQSVNPKKILAITFTRKARLEMMDRITNKHVQVETFNSFCEKFLQKHNDEIYDQQFRVLGYRDKIFMVKRALASINLTMRQAIGIYFTANQRKGKEDKKLAHIFLNDLFFLRDYFKSKNMTISKDSFDVDATQVRSFNIVIDLCAYLEKDMLRKGFRDFTDQLLDTIKLFKQQPDLVPQFEHILVDEYQDVNGAQIEFIDLLNPQKLFCVGDPRQSIYGWRGSDVKHIVGFEEKYPTCEIITLTNNYRSNQHIVKLSNDCIKPMGMPNLDSVKVAEKEMDLKKCATASKEYESVVERVLNSDLPRNEIMILARTNRQLNDMATHLTKYKIKHVVRSDENRRLVEAGAGEVTLATIHAIKGLEAEMVCIIGCTSQHFPCKGSEHPVIDMIKVDAYDKEEEERRLFYVAISRAKQQLYLSYTGKAPTYFLTPQMIAQFNQTQRKVIGFASVASRPIAAKQLGTNISLLEKLKRWRSECSRTSKTAAYRIMHDRTLEELASKRPQSFRELEQISGLGLAKITKYGQELLSLVG